MLCIVSDLNPYWLQDRQARTLLHEAAVVVLASITAGGAAALLGHNDGGGRLAFPCRQCEGKDQDEQDKHPEGRH